jgi:beta-glucosidase
LSYTTFDYSDLSVTTTLVTLNVSNSGKLAGAETVQLYISPDKMATIARPVKELKGFSKVYLQPGETRRVEISLERFSTSYWDQELHMWVCEKGQYRILIGSSSHKVLLEGVLDVEKTTTWSGL